MKRGCIAFAILMVILLAISCGPSAPPPQITEEQINLAVQGIKEYPDVQDAAVCQEGEKLSLVVIVDYGTSEERAKELGDDFVRLVKTFGPEPAPSKEIGEGMFDYIIGVAYPNEEIVATGAKVSFADHITW
jgi:hypothetical protein